MSNNSQQLSVRRTAFPNGKCPTSFEELAEWITSWSFSIGDVSSLLSSSANFAVVQDGNIPAPEDRSKIIIVVDENGDPIRLGKYTDSEGDGCCGPGSICCISCHNVGELKTVYRQALTLEEEPIPAGWQLTQGEGITPDLQSNTNFWATGTDPDYYTIMYTGC